MLTIAIKLAYNRQQSPTQRRGLLGTMMTKTPKTLREALALRQAENDAFNARCDSRAAEAKRIHNLMQSNPQIGALNRDGKAVYYTFPAGGVYKEAKKIETLI